LILAVFLRRIRGPSRWWRLSLPLTFGASLLALHALGQTLNL